MFKNRTIYKAIKNNKEEVLFFVNGYHYEGSNPLSTKGDYKVYYFTFCWKTNDNEYPYDTDGETDNVRLNPFELGNVYEGDHGDKYEVVGEVDTW